MVYGGGSSTGSSNPRLRSGTLSASLVGGVTGVENEGGGGVTSVELLFPVGLGLKGLMRNGFLDGELSVAISALDIDSGRVQEELYHWEELCTDCALSLTAVTVMSEPWNEKLRVFGFGTRAKYFTSSRSTGPQDYFEQPRVQLPRQSQQDIVDADENNLRDRRRSTTLEWMIQDDGKDQDIPLTSGPGNNPQIT